MYAAPARVRHFPFQPCVWLHPKGHIKGNTPDIVFSKPRISALDIHTRFAYKTPCGRVAEWQTRLTQNQISFRV